MDYFCTAVNACKFISSFIAGTDNYGDFPHGSVELIPRNVHLTCKHINVQTKLLFEFDSNILCIYARTRKMLCIYLNTIIREHLVLHFYFMSLFTDVALNLDYKKINFIQDALKIFIYNKRRLFKFKHWI